MEEIQYRLMENTRDAKTNARLYKIIITYIHK